MIVKQMRKMSLVILDVLMINLTLLCAVLLHHEGVITKEIWIFLLQNIFIVSILKLGVFYYFKLYSSLWAYASIEELIQVVLGVVAGNALMMIYIFTVGTPLFLGIYLTATVFEVMAIGGIRFGYRLLRRVRQHKPLTRLKEDKSVLIYGSGATACLIANEMKNHSGDYGRVVGFIDDDLAKYHKTIGGIKVLGNRDDLYSIIRRFLIEEILIADPNLSAQSLKELLTECKKTDAKVKIMPGVRELIGGHVSMNRIRDVEIEDLLGRDAVDLDLQAIASYVQDKVVMITGGGGSIGSELCRQIAKFSPERLIILDIYENNAYEIQNELIREYKESLDLDVIIASVRDRTNIFKIMMAHMPDVVFHAAAHKHVPLMERTPAEAIKNNVFGTMNVAEAAHAAQVERFVLISTDKAVNPTNVMGASKRLCEMVIQGIAKQSKTKYAAVRFGNVLGSNGSVIPLFKKQIAAGGPVTVTHKEIIRYFMTIPEAAQLVIQAGAIADEGEIFVLDMGEPVKIYDLAKDLIRLSGLKPGEDIKIEVTGLRPGEKLYEELLTDEEGLGVTRYDKIHVGQPGEVSYAMLKKSFNQLEAIIQDQDDAALMEMIHYMVPTYRKNHEVNEEKGHMVETGIKYGYLSQKRKKTAAKATHKVNHVEALMD